jgi:hypothetical protein
MIQVKTVMKSAAALDWSFRSLALLPEPILNLTDVAEIRQLNQVV